MPAQRRKQLSCHFAVISGMTQDGTGTILVRGVRAMGQALGVSPSTAARWAQARIVPAVMLSGKWTLIPSPLTYAAALAQILLRREHSLAAAPREGGSVPGLRPAASTPPRCKKMSPKRFGEEEVVTLK